MKKIWTPFLALAIFGCASEESSEVQTQKSAQRTASSMTIEDFALTHCELGLKIFDVYQDELEAGREIDEKAIHDLANVKTKEEAINILKFYGMNEDNAAEVVDLSISQVENYQRFIEDNPDFKMKDEKEQQYAVDNAIVETIKKNPNGTFPVYDQTTYSDPRFDCNKKKRNDLKDCFEDFLITSAAGTLGGAYGFCAGVLVASVRAHRCEARAWRNWHHCLDAAGIAIH